MDEDILIKLPDIAMINKLSLRLLQPRCILCDMPVDSDSRFLCLLCSEELPYINKSLCLHCGQPYATPHRQNLNNCPECSIERSPWQHLIPCMYYTLECKYLIRQLKFAKQVQIGTLFGRLLSHTITSQITRGNIQRPEALLSIPLHRKRQHKRGYNQAHVIAQELAKQLQIPLISADKFIRTKYTEPQSLQSMDMRKRNIRDAFKVVETLNVKHIALIDDVVTTGETIREACNVLVESDVQCIDIWCVARTLAD